MTLLKVIMILMALAYTCTTTEIKYKNIVWKKTLQKWQCYFHIPATETKKKSAIKRVFGNQLDAAISLNRLCDKFGVPHKNIEVDGIPVPIDVNAKKTYPPYWDKRTKKWEARLYLSVNEHYQYGGRFENIEDAKKSINQLCENHNLPEKFPGLGKISFIAKLQTKTSKYIGVSWHALNKTWKTIIQIKGNKIYGGYFKSEINAAKRINQICDKYNLQHKNEGIGSDALLKLKSKYTGVHWDSRNKKYRVLIWKNKTPIFGGYFKDIVYAVKKVNELCDENDMARKHPMAGTNADSINDETKEITIEFEEDDVDQNFFRKRKRGTDNPYLYNDLKEKIQQKEIIQQKKLKDKIKYEYFFSDFLKK